MPEDKKPQGLLSKVLEAGSAQLDSIIAKARQPSNFQSSDPDEEVFYGKSVYKDLSISLGTQGFQEKAARLSYYYLKQMAIRDSIVSAIIQTRQNQVASFSKPVQNNHERGYRIVLKNEKKALEEVRAEMFGTGEQEDEEADPLEQLKQQEPQMDDSEAVDDARESNSDPDDFEKAFFKALDKANMPKKGSNEEEEQVDAHEGEKESKQAELQPGEGTDSSEDLGEDDLDDRSDENHDAIEEDPAIDDDQMGMDDNGDPTQSGQDNAQSDQAQLEEEQDQLRKAKIELHKRIAPKVEAISEFVQNCGYTKNRPFETKKWSFDSWLRASVRDSLTYDQYASELVPDNVGELHHFFPMDASTVRYSTPEIKNYKNMEIGQSGYDILYPEKELVAMENSDALELDETKLQNDEYKWVQVLNGRIVRGFTENELSVGMRNPTTDIFANGYSIAELEILLRIVSSHLFTENYNMSYFTQGFSAKGILHIKADLPRRKMESARVMWQHMIKGNRNSFQTPIMASSGDIQWIPLTQNHSDIEFNLWMQYLIRVICAIYQIDPSEIGFGMKDMGEGGSLSGENTESKINQSKDRGLVPLLRHVENYLNTNVIDRLDPDFKIEFVGVSDESKKEVLERQEKEVKFKKSVNEVRSEDGLPPIPGADNLILDPIFFQWWSQFSEEGKAFQAEQREQQAQQMHDNFGTGDEDSGQDDDEEGGDPSANPMDSNPATAQKSLSTYVARLSKK